MTLNMDDISTMRLTPILEAFQKLPDQSIGSGNHRFVAVDEGEGEAPVLTLLYPDEDERINFIRIGPIPIYVPEGQNE